MTATGTPSVGAPDTLESAGGPSVHVRGRRGTRIGGIFGGAVMLLAVVVAVFAPALAPAPPNQVDLSMAHHPPTWNLLTREFMFGADSLGRDVLSRTMYGARVSMLVGALAVLGSGLIGVTVGLLSGYRGRWTDRLAVWVIDVQMSVPFLALAILLVGILGPGLRNTVIALIVSGWILYARVVRAETLSIRERDWAQAAVALGAADARVMVRHVLPNLAPAIITIASFEFARMILMEASLSFLGLGVQPPTATWGGMIADSRSYLHISPWVMAVPGAALTLVVLAGNLLGDYLRDALSVD